MLFVFLFFRSSILCMQYIHPFLGMFAVGGYYDARLPPIESPPPRVVRSFRYHVDPITCRIWGTVAFLERL